LMHYSSDSQIAKCFSFISAKLFIACCQFQLISSQHLLQHKKMFAKLGILFHRYTWQLHNSCHAVYARVSVQCPQFYIGSTKHTSFLRERTRLRKYKQMTKGKLVQAEPSLQFWKCTKTFFQFLPVTIKKCSAFTLLASEMHLIQQNQPTLNAPLVFKLIKKRMQPSFSSSKLSRTINHSNKRWRKANLTVKNRCGGQVAKTGITHAKQAWNVICKLCFSNYQRFITSRYLRSSRVQTEQLYALYRQSQHLSDSS